MPTKTTETVDDFPARTVERLARDAERAAAIPFEDIEGGLFARVLDEGERVEVVNLEHTLAAPRAPRGDATLWDPADFVSYVNRLASASTTLWADPEAARITAVFDDHTDAQTAGWRRHRATLDVRRDPEWQAWVNRSGHLGTQEEFAEHLEDHYAAVVNPDAATMLEVATTFQAHRNSAFERGTRLQSGDVQLRYSDTTSASAGARGHLEVPETFTISVAPFLGVAPVEITARLRYRIADGRLRIGYVLHRPDLAEREAFDRIRATVIDGVSADAHLGAAPGQLHRDRNADRRM
ncbi:DUF2303 family protein [Pseudonocardia sp. D17]|uniref:DUF2303 family protein n=1 Tax=Pseudonocardia sp. D17 TaxID=882661 RepID=UPI002B37F47C|nr:hypothetical protein PSD17_56590 [Pseudonocardia sp. D17]